MKKFILAAALVVAYATSAAAFELGNGFALDTTVDAGFDTGTELFTTLVTPNLSYTPVDNLTLWMETELTVYNGSDLQFDKNAFPGILVGINYALPVVGAVSSKLYLESNFDNDFNHTSTFVGVSLSF
jgi:hypothetical protein